MKKETFATRLSKLSDAATQGEWYVAHPNLNRTKSWARRITLTPDSARGDIANVIAGLGSSNTESDAELICLLVNRRREILALVEAARDSYENGTNEARIKLGDALANLNRAQEGE